MKKDYYNAARRLTINEVSHQVVFLIINRNDYKEAARAMVENNLSIEELSENTMKLTSRHLAKLTDEILSLK